MHGKVKIADILKFIILYSIVVSFCQSMLGLPTALFYLNDFMLIIVFITCGEYILKKKTIPIPRAMIMVSAILVIATLIGFIINSYSPLFYLWGLRNNFRAIIFFIACCICLKKKDVYEICNLLMKLLPMNVVLCTIQYFMALNSGDAKILKFIGDHVGGIFGSTKGCNRILNIYLIFIYQWAFAMYLRKDIQIRRFAYVLLCCAYIAILSELKIIILEIMVTSIVLIWVIHRGHNKAFYTVFFFILFVLLIDIWSMFSPAVARLVRSLEEIVSYSSVSSYGENSLNRLTVIPYMHNLLLEDSVHKILFGIGLGNADTSNFAFLSTPNFQRYGYLKYNNFMSGMLYVETGVLGLLFYIAFFVVNFFASVKIARRKGITDSIAYSGIVFNLVAVLCIFYNTTLRSEVSNYLSFFFLAIPIIMCNRYDDPTHKIITAL